MSDASPEPTISVVIPHYARTERLKRTLIMLLDQIFTDWEAIIVDDDSPMDPREAVAAIIPPPRARVVRLAQNSGPSVARNVGVAEARGRFVAFLDSDDHWDPAKLARQIEAVMARPDPDRTLCYCRSRVRHGHGLTADEPERGIMATENPADYLFINGGFAQTSSIFIGRTAAKSFGFDPELRQYEDYLYFIVACEYVTDVVFIPESLSEWDDEPRPDRLSRGASRSIASANRFIARAGARLGRRARLRFLMTNLGADLFAEAWPRALGIAGAAIAAGVVTPRYALRQALRAILTPERWDRLRSNA